MGFDILTYRKGRIRHIAEKDSLCTRPSWTVGGWNIFSMINPSASSTAHFDSVR